MQQAILDFLRRVWQTIKEFWQKTERKDRVRFIAISSLAIIGVIVAVVFLTRVEYTVLYSEMEDTELSEVKAIIDAAGVRTKVEGNTLLVPAARATDMRLMLAGEGYPKSGFNYDYLANIDSFGSSDYEKRMWSRIQIENNLRADLMSGNAAIRDARVIISQPESSNTLLKAEKIPVTASVSLTLNEELLPEQITGIMKLVSSSYPDLQMEDVTVTDQYMNLLNPKEPTQLDIFAERLELLQQIKTKYERDVNSMFVPIFGADRFRATAFVELNFDEVTQERETYTPSVDEDGMVRSLQTIAEEATGGMTGGQVGEDENGGDVPIYDETTTQGETWKSTTETINYEINQLKETITKEIGAQVDVKMSIAIDSNELSEDLSSNARAIQELAAGVLGIPREEYNDVVVQILPFQGLVREQEAIAEIEAQLRQDQLFELIRTLALYVVLLVCLILIIWRVFKLFRKGPTEEELLEMQRAAEMEDLDEYADLVKLAAAPGEIEETKTPERMKIEDFVERSPDMVANLLRNWLSEETPRRR